MLLTFLLCYILSVDIAIDTTKTNINPIATEQTELYNLFKNELIKNNFTDYKITGDFKPIYKTNNGGYLIQK
jgi:hypothetical protein